MKKNKTMRLASVLLVMTLLTTSIISGTLAKYTSTGSASDTARVAKWGVTVSASGTLFGSKYANGVSSIPTTLETPSAISVEGKNSSGEAVEVVAPGTQSADTGFTFGITGTPEVDNTVSAVIEAKDIYLKEGTYGVMKEVTVDAINYSTMLDKGLYTLNDKTYTKVTATTYSSGTYYALAYTATVGDGGYYPVEYSYYSNGTSGADTTKATEIALVIAANFVDDLTKLENADKTDAGVSYTVSKSFDSNVDLTDTTNGIGIKNEKLTWAWAFSSTDNANDTKDTLLGDLMAAGTSNDKVVAVGTDNAVTVLTVGTDNIVKNGKTEVGCLETKFDIKLTVEQVD
jgi:hypothetical protein